MGRLSDFRNEAPVARRPHLIAPDLSSVHVVFIIHRSEPGLPGSDAGLGVTIKSTMRVLRRHGVHCESWSVAHVDQLTDRLEKAEWADDRPITHVVINTPNFATPVQIGKLAQRWHETEFIQLNHTGLSYMCIDNNGPQRIRDTLALQRATHNVKVAGNNPRFRWFDTYGVDTLLLPNLYDTETFVTTIGHRRDHDPLRVGCFGENRPWKNQQVAAQAALLMGKRLGVAVEFYVNGDRWPQTWPMSQARRELFDGLPWAKLIEVKWDHWPRFRQTIGTMDVCLHPSFDETFCTVVADGIAEGVPSVVTSAMEWAPHEWIAQYPHDPASIAAIGLALLHDRAGAVAEGRRALSEFVAAGVQRWIAYLTA